jgi:hypothetical protein
VVILGGFALISSISSCSSFTTGSSSGEATPGLGGDGGTPQQQTDGSTLDDSGSVNGEDGGGECFRPFASHFTGTVPLFDGFHRDAVYGDQGTLTLTSAIGTGGRGNDGVLKIGMDGTATVNRGRSLIRDIFVGSGPRRCATAKVAVHMRIVMNVHQHTSSLDAVLVMLARFDKQHDLVIGLNKSGFLEIAQQDLTATPKGYDALGQYPLGADNWHTIEVSLTYDPAGVPRVSASVNSQPVNINGTVKLVDFLDPREFHVGALYAHPIANAEYEIDEASIF